VCYSLMDVNIGCVSCKIVEFANSVRGRFVLHINWMECGEGLMMSGFKNPCFNTVM
jgi:hypothetical protein